MISAFKHEICGGANCSRCLAGDRQWIATQERFFGVVYPWPCHRHRLAPKVPEIPAIPPNLAPSVAGWMPPEMWEETTAAYLANDPSMSHEMTGACNSLAVWLKAGGSKRLSGCGVCDARKAKMWEVRRHAIGAGWVPPRVLIVGNANQPLGVSLDAFDQIWAFNRMQYHFAKIKDKLSRHFLRSTSTALDKHSGEELICQHKAVPVLVDAGTHGQELAKQWADRGAYCIRCREMIDYYPSGKVPSTGYAVTRQAIAKGMAVTLTCFTWQGSAPHDWEFERNTLAGLKMKIIKHEI